MVHTRFVWNGFQSVVLFSGVVVVIAAVVVVVVVAVVVVVVVAVVVAVVVVVVVAVVAAVVVVVVAIVVVVLVVAAAGVVVAVSVALDTTKAMAMAAQRSTSSYRKLELIQHVPEAGSPSSSPVYWVVWLFIEPGHWDGSHHDSKRIVKDRIFSPHKASGNGSSGFNGLSRKHTVPVI